VEEEERAVNPANEARVALDVDALGMATALVGDVQRGALMAFCRDDKVAQRAIEIMRYMGYDVAIQRTGELLGIFTTVPGEDHSG
jgi:hypothetical protein